MCQAHTVKPQCLSLQEAMVSQQINAQAQSTAPVELSAVRQRIMWQTPNGTLWGSTEVPMQLRQPTIMWGMARGTMTGRFPPLTMAGNSGSAASA